MYCGWARIIGIEVSTCRDYDRADATKLCGTILMMSEEEEMENRRCDTSVPATNPSPIVLVQIGLQKPHERRPSPVVLQGRWNEDVY